MMPGKQRIGNKPKEKSEPVCVSVQGINGSCDKGTSQTKSIFCGDRCLHFNCAKVYNRFAFLAALFSCSWLTSQFGQVSCLFQQSSMEARNCSDFVTEEYPQISVSRGGKTFTESFEINQTSLLDHEIFHFKCVARYPITWFWNGLDLNHSPSSAVKAATAHLHIYRTFSNFFDRNSYRFGISTRVRYKKGIGFKQMNGTCRSIVKPLCLSTTIASRDEVDGVSLQISFDPPKHQNNHRKKAPVSALAYSNSKRSNHNRAKLRRLPEEENDEDNDSVETGEEEENENFCDYKIYYRNEGADGSRLSFTCEKDDGTPTSIQFTHQCSNAMTCLNLFRDSRLPSGCAQPHIQNFTCVGCESRQLRLSQGMIGCDESSPSSSSTAEDESRNTYGAAAAGERKAKRLLFFFTSLPEGRSPTKLYFRMEDAQPSEMIRLSEIPHQVYLGEQLTVTCNVSNFYFAGETRMALKFADSDTLKFLNTVSKKFELPDQFDGTTVEATLSITTTSLERVYCFAPVWNSFEWVNQSRAINVKEVISGDIIVAVGVTIFLTALLVALMFGILWIKVGKTHGRLNLLTTSEIEEFRRASFVADESKPIKMANSFNDLAYGTAATYDPIYEIKRDKLLLDETVILGYGQFGLVLKGIVNDTQNKVRIDVAVKTLKTKVDVGSLKALLSELKILASVGKHTNVVNLVGACTKKMGKGEVYVAVEYCANGNLQNFLRRHRQAFRNQLENDVLVIETPIRKLSTSSENIMTIDLIRWAWEIAKGMEFLASKKVIHGDLATRNILLTEDHVAKVSDFGLSRQLVDYYYVQKETGPMPWKWMSLESLSEYKFSIQSDVWSFGVTLWELFTLAEIPYSGCSWSAEFVETLAAGHRLGKPKFATSEMYDLMRECWKTDPTSRPSFFAIKMFFEDILTQCTSQEYVQINAVAAGVTGVDDEYQHMPLLQSPRIIIEEEGEDDVFE